MAILDWSFGPLSEFDRLRREVEDLFERFGISSAGGAFPAVNVYEDGGEYLVAAQAPGLSKRDIQAEVRENVLTISGTRKPPEYEAASTLRQECPYGEFRRSLRMPTKIKHDAVQASFKDGILLVHIPKADEISPKPITIDA